MKKFKIGDTVWFLEHWSQMPQSGIITEFGEVDSDKIHPTIRTYAKLKLNIGGSMSVLMDDLYDTKEELIEVVHQKSRKNIENMKEEIKNVTDLIKFMFENTISSGSGEYIDYDARNAAIERAKELLNIDLID